MNLFDFPEHIERYAEAHTSPEEDVLHELYRKTYLKTVHPQMLSGKVQGRFLKMVSMMIRPTSVLEIGTFTGYSAYCLAAGLQDGGEITTIEVNEELEPMVSSFFQKAGIAEKTELIIGDALEVLPSLDKKFDLVFIDANKEHYPMYYELCIEKLRPGGFLLADNVLWNGKVATIEAQDESTLKLQAFNQMVQDDDRVENVFLTIRDGIMLLRRKNV